MSHETNKVWNKGTSKFEDPKIFISPIPDWSEVWTPAEAEAQLQGFKFTGAGWYITNEDAMLVVPNVEDTKPWQVQTEKYWFYVYNNPHTSAIFNAIANAPVRKDAR